MHAKVDTGGKAVTVMAGKGWYKPVLFTCVFAGFVLIAIGAVFTESGMDEIAYGTSGQFVIDASNVDASIIVVTDEVEGNCENFDFMVDHHDGDGGFIPVEKTDCENWSSADSYQYRLNNLTEGRYGFSASDWVSIMAVEGDLDAFMTKYAFGNTIADIGSAMCCIGVALSFLTGWGITQARQAGFDVVVGQTNANHSSGDPVFVQATHPLESPPSEHAEVPVEDEAPAGGTFWENMTKD